MSPLVVKEFWGTFVCANHFVNLFFKGGGVGSYHSTVIPVKTGIYVFLFCGEDLVI